MGAINDHEFGKYIGTGRITGSIQRIWALTEITLTDYTMGRFVSSTDVDINASPNKATITGTADITIAANNYLDGPFIAANVSAGTGIVYYNGTLL